MLIKQVWGFLDYKMHRDPMLNVDFAMVQKQCQCC